TGATMIRHRIMLSSGTTPVIAPARNPPQNPAAVANTGSTPRASNTAAIAAPNGREPSTVMSAKWRILKLIKTPSAKKERISPRERAPIKRVILFVFQGAIRDRTDPTSAPGKLALTRAGYFTIIMQEMEQSLRCLYLKEVRRCS